MQESQEAPLQRRRGRVLRDGYAGKHMKKAGRPLAWTCVVARQVGSRRRASRSLSPSPTGRSIHSMPTRTRWSADAARELQITSWETKIKDVKLPRRRNIRNRTVTAYGPTDRCNTCRGLGGARSGQGRARTTASRTCDRSWSPEAGQTSRSDASGASPRDRASWTDQCRDA